MIRQKPGKINWLFYFAPFFFFLSLSLPLSLSIYTPSILGILSKYRSHCTSLTLYLCQHTPSFKSQYKKKKTTQLFMHYIQHPEAKNFFLKTAIIWFFFIQFSRGKERPMRTATICAMLCWNLEFLCCSVLSATMRKDEGKRKNIMQDSTRPQLPLQCWKLGLSLWKSC